MASLLALDASKYVGWAYFKSPADKPHCRTWMASNKWAGDEYGAYFLEFETWLENMLAIMTPDVLAFESPIVIGRRDGRGSDESNIRRLIGVVSIAEKVAVQRSMRCVEVHNQTAKAYVGVSARRAKMSDAEYKGQMIIAMTRRGYRVADSHQADACAVALVAYDDLGTPVAENG